MPKNFSRETRARVSAGSGGRIVCLYGRPYEPWAEPIAQDLRRSAPRNCSIEVWLLGEVLGDPVRRREVERLYVLPFAMPGRLPPGFPSTPGPFLKRLFPRAEIVNSVSVHELCLDKIALARRLLSRGVPMPETLVTDDPEEARAFVFRHGTAIRKEPQSRNGSGHLVLFADDEGVVGGEARGRRYLVEFFPDVERPRLEHGVLQLPGPYLLQKLIAGADRHGRLLLPQILRAYIVAGEVAFWTEIYRSPARRPSDFIVSIANGARYRFLPAASDELEKLARRAAEVLGIQYGAVDLIRSGTEGPYVLEADTDGPHGIVGRGFKQLPEFRPPYDLDALIARALCS